MISPRRLAPATLLVVLATTSAASAVGLVKLHGGTYTAKLDPQAANGGQFPKFPLSFRLSKTGAVSDLKIGPIKLECDGTGGSQVLTIPRLEGFPTVRNSPGFFIPDFQYRGGHWKRAQDFDFSNKTPSVEFRVVYAPSPSPHFNDNGGGQPAFRFAAHVTASGKLSPTGAYLCQVNSGPGKPLFRLKG